MAARRVNTEAVQRPGPPNRHLWLSRDLRVTDTALDPATLVVGEALTLRYGAATIVEGVDITLRRGEITTIIGPNGAGKTTLLKLVLGLVPPSAGRVRRRAGLRVGYLPQRLHVEAVLPMTVSRLMTLTVRRSPAEVVAALAETGVAHLAAAAVQSLSGGELQRVLLGRALLANPDLLVLDEPVQGVDYAGEAALYELIGGLRRQRGCGILMVSHDIHVVMAATDHVLCLNRHVCCAGTPEAVGQHPEYVRLFGPRAAPALAVYTHHHDHAHDAAGDVVPLRDGSHPDPASAPSQPKAR
ncbi:MAG: zinc ABC transporter ATP-binding protein ZnuC [Rhodospirillales bacterium]|nr:zinc ABC transporter ATP-binding protein ZnuC [Rhodospirillales bacterium]